MISAWIVFRVSRRKNPHAPVSLMIGLGELLDHALSLIFIKLLKPHRNRRQNAGHIDAVAICIKGVGIDLLFSRPECLIQNQLRSFETLLQFFGKILFTHKMSEVRKGACGFKTQRCLVKLNPHGIEWSAFDPAGPYTGVLCQSLRVVCRSEKLVSSSEVVPFLFSESNVSPL